MRKKNVQEENQRANLAKTVEVNPGYDGELGFVCREVNENESEETMHQSESSGGGERETAFVCIDGRHYPAFKGDTMIAKSSCSCHLVKNGEFLEEAQDIQKSIRGI